MTIPLCVTGTYRGMGEINTLSECELYTLKILLATLQTIPILSLESSYKNALVWFKNEVGLL